MLFTLKLPRISEPMTSAVVIALHAKEGQALQVGAPLLDLNVDLRAAAPQDCPPVAAYRIALRQPLWLRCWRVRKGEDLPSGTVLALLSSEPDETLEGAEPRPARVTVAGIVANPGFWDDTSG